MGSAFFTVVVKIVIDFRRNDKSEVENQIASVSERNSEPFRATDVRQGWSGEAAEPLLG
jgi:hypothetical protein